MQNGPPHVSKVDHTSFCVISKLFTQTFFIGRGDDADFEGGDNDHGHGDYIFGHSRATRSSRRVVGREIPVGKQEQEPASARRTKTAKL